MNNNEEILDKWREKLTEIRNLGRVKLLPTSRRIIKSKRHPYGWEIRFYQTIVWPDGKRARIAFSDIGTNKRTAIGNSLRQIETASIAFSHPDAKALEL